MSRPAVGEILTSHGSRGTAFAVTSTRILTCWHCVANPRDRTRPAQETVTIRLDPTTEVRATYLNHAPELDLAVLEIETGTPLPDGWEPITLGCDADLYRSAVVQIIGWPVHNPSSTQPQILPAEVTVPRTTIRDGRPVVQLFSREVAARLRPRGFSGGPVLAESVHGRTAVGVVQWMQEDELDEQRALGGTIYAVRVGEVRKQWPELAPPTEPLSVIAGDAAAPARTLVENFVNSHLKGPGGRLPFAGRAAELAALNAWLDDPDAPGYHLISGQAGTGKSTLLMRWVEDLAVRRGADVHLVVVPVSLRHGLTGARDVLQALVHRVARVHGVSYNRTASTAETRDELAGLLRRPAPDGTTLLVVVDALDEAGDWEPGAQHFPQPPGARVRLALSARHTRSRPSPRAWTKALGLPSSSGSTTLAALGADAFEELLRQVRPTRNAADAEITAVVATRLHQLTEGDPVTTALYLQDLADQPETALDRWAAGLDRARPGLAGFFVDWWEDQARLWRFRQSDPLDDTERVLNLLVVAEGPLQLAQLRLLARRMGASMSGARVHQALKLADRFVLTRQDSDTITVAHPLIGQMLRTRLRNYGELAEYEEAFIGWGREVLDKLFARTLAPAQVPGYLTRHLAAHLLPAPDPAGDDKSAASLADAYRLTHPLWRQALDATADNLDGYPSDVARVAMCARQVNERAVKAGRPPPHLAEQVCCAAVAAGEQTALSQEMTPELVAQLVRHDLWRPSRALAYLAGEWEAVRAKGVAALAPYLEVQDLPALWQIVETLHKPYLEWIVPATAGWARRALELGRPQEAIAAAGWLPEGHEQRDFVRIWVWAELVPRLPRHLAGVVLADAIEVLCRSPERLAFAACHLTKLVPLEFAETLWPYADYAALPHDLQRKYPKYTLARYGPGCGPGELLCAAVDRECLTYRHCDGPFSEPTESWESKQSTWEVCLQEFVGAARWLSDDHRVEVIQKALHRVRIDLDESGDQLRRALVPDLHCEGLLSVLPREFAPWVADLLLHRIRHGVNRTVCLLLLLPLLDPEEREACADAAFAEPEHLKNMNSSSLDVGPVVATTGYAGRVLDAIESGGLPQSEGSNLLVAMAPHLSRAETERALTMFEPSPGARDTYSPRRWLLARLAQFGVDDALRALDLLYFPIEGQPLTPELTYLLRRYIAADHRANGEAEYGTPWWEDCVMYLGVERQWRTGIKRYRRRLRYIAPLPELLDALPDHVGSQTLIDLAVDIAGSLVEDEVPILLAWVDRKEGLGPWEALTVLAAGTRLPDGPAYNAVVDEIVTRLKVLRDRALSQGTTAKIGRDGFPGQSPWLVRGIGDWTPFFVRILAPKAQAVVRPVLFDDGYLEGALRRHASFFGDEHDRLDDWAHDILALTPILEPAELDRLRVIGNAIKSEGTRKAFEGGLAVGYAACGQMGDTYELIRWTLYETKVILTSALADVVTQVPTDALPEWLAQVHLMPLDAYDRGSLWAIMNDRWPELTREQLWEVLDRWTSELPFRGRFGVCADILNYKYAVRALAGPQECKRILDLLGIGPVLTDEGDG